MKKAKKAKDTMPYQTAAVPWKPPTPKERIRQSTEDLARTVVEHHPRLKKLRDGISRAVHGAVRKALPTAVKKGGFGGGGY